ncbi:MAG: TMEM175 family protein [Bradyrhizobium sp.]
MFAKTRLDALTDGVFAVAMTLLVLDVRLPEDFHPANDGELLHGLVSLWPKFLPYVLSFGVLGLRWIASIEIRSRNEHFARNYVNWWLLYLLLITFVPFSTIVVGRYAHFAPAIWLYAGHTLLIALISMRMVALTPEIERGDRLRQRQTSSAFLAGSSLLAIVLSFVDPRIALWGFALNFTQPVLERWRRTKVG